MNEKADNKYEIYKQAQSFYNFLYLFVIVILWIWKWKSYDPASSGGFEAVKAMERALLPGDCSMLRSDAASSVFGFLIISNIRLYLGGAYCNRDRSFIEALVKVGYDTRPKLLLMYATVELLSIIALMRSSLVSVSCGWIVPAFVFLEGVIIISFDVRFRRVYSEDKDYGFNLICLCNDGLFAILATVWLWFACKWLEPTSLARHWGSAMWLFGGIALLELGLAYQQSLRHSLTDTGVALKAIVFGGWKGF